MRLDLSFGILYEMSLLLIITNVHRIVNTVSQPFFPIFFLSHEPWESVMCGNKWFCFSAQNGGRFSPCSLPGAKRADGVRDNLVKILKSLTARRLFQLHPEIKKVTEWKSVDKRLLCERCWFVCRERCNSKRCRGAGGNIQSVMLRNPIWVAKHFRCRGFLHHGSSLQTGVRLIRRCLPADGKCFSCTGILPGVGTGPSCPGIPDPSRLRNPVLSMDV